MNYEKIELLIEIAMFSTISSTFTMIFIQAIKEKLNTGAKIFGYLSGILSFFVGFGFATIFSDYSIIYCFVSGTMVFAGADKIYKSLEENGKVLSIKELENKKTVKVPVENEIKRGE